MQHTFKTRHIYLKNELEIFVFPQRNSESQYRYEEGYLKSIWNLQLGEKSNNNHKVTNPKPQR